MQAPNDCMFSDLDESETQVKRITRDLKTVKVHAKRCDELLV